MNSGIQYIMPSKNCKDFLVISKEDGFVMGIVCKYSISKRECEEVTIYRVKLTAL